MTIAPRPGGVPGVGYGSHMTTAIHRRSRDLRPLAGWIAIAGSLLALGVEVRWLLRAEAGRPEVIGVCALIAVLAIAARPSSAQVGARITGFAALVVAVPASLLLLTATTSSPPSPRIAGVDSAATSVAVTREVFRSADAAVVIAAGDLGVATSAASLAAATGSPLLITPADELSGDVAAELERLGVERTVVAGVDLEVVAALADAGVSVEALPSSSTIATAVNARASGTTVVLVADGADVGPTVASAVARNIPIVHGWTMESAAALLELGTTTVVVDGPADLRLVVADAMPDLRVRSGLADLGGSGPVWLAAHRAPTDLLLAAVAAAVEDGELVALASDSIPELQDSRVVRVVGGTAAVPPAVIERLRL